MSEPQLTGQGVVGAPGAMPRAEPALAFCPLGFHLLERPLPGEKEWSQDKAGGPSAVGRGGGVHGWTRREVVLVLTRVRGRACEVAPNPGSPLPSHSIGLSGPSGLAALTWNLRKSSQPGLQAWEEGMRWREQTRPGRYSRNARPRDCTDFRLTAAGSSWGSSSASTGPSRPPLALAHPDMWLIVLPHSAPSGLGAARA